MADARIAAPAVWFLEKGGCSGISLSLLLLKTPLRCDGHGSELSQAAGSMVDMQRCLCLNSMLAC